MSPTLAPVIMNECSWARHARLHFSSSLETWCLQLAPCLLSLPFLFPLYLICHHVTRFGLESSAFIPTSFMFFLWGKEPFSELPPAPRSTAVHLTATPQASKRPDMFTGTVKIIVFLVSLYFKLNSSHSSFPEGLSVPTSSFPLMRCNYLSYTTDTVGSS